MEGGAGNKRLKLTIDLIDQVQTHMSGLLTELTHDEQALENERQANQVLRRENNRALADRASVTQMISDYAKRTIEIASGLSYLMIRFDERPDFIEFRTSPYGKLIETGMEALAPLHNFTMKREINREALVAVNKALVRAKVSKHRPLQEMLYSFDSRMEFTAMNVETKTVRFRLTDDGEPEERQVKWGVIEAKVAVADLPELEKQVNFFKFKPGGRWSDTISLNVVHIHGLPEMTDKCTGCERGFQLEELRSYGLTREGPMCVKHPLHICCAALAALQGGGDKPIDGHEYVCPICTVEAPK